MVEIGENDASSTAMVVSRCAVVLTAGQETGPARDLVQVVVVTLAVEIEQGVTRGHAGIAVLGQRRPNHGVAVLVRDLVV